LFFPCNHITNIKKNPFSGKVKDSVIFLFYFVLHKLHKPIPPLALSLRPPIHPSLHHPAIHPFLRAHPALAQERKAKAKNASPNQILHDKILNETADVIDAIKEMDNCSLWSGGLNNG
jgi:hypothetical protein